MDECLVTAIANATDGKVSVDDVVLPNVSTQVDVVYGCYLVLGNLYCTIPVVQVRCILVVFNEVDVNRR